MEVFTMVMDMEAGSRRTHILNMRVRKVKGGRWIRPLGRLLLLFLVEGERRIRMTDMGRGADVL
jgi:hypothetical protein